LAKKDDDEFFCLRVWMDMNKRITAATLSGLSLVLLTGCAELSAMYVARDMKKASDEHEQEKHEERVEELNKEYEEFLKSQGKAGTDDEESEQSIVIMKDNIETD
jgi:hypothetical protein